MAWIGCAQPVAARWVNRNRIDQSHVSDAMSGVAAGVQGALQTIWKRALDQNAIGDPLVMETRRIDGQSVLHSDSSDLHSGDG